MKRLSFVKKQVLVTGAGSGMGRKIAIDFAKGGAHIILAGRTMSALECTAHEIDELGSTCDVVRTDISDSSSVEALLEHAISGGKTMDIAVNAAGVFKSGHIDETDVTSFNQVFETNTFGTWLCMKHEILAMKQRKSAGTIVNIGSNIGCNLIRAGTGAYAASKAAISVLTRTAALEAIGFGIRINCVSPGPSDTTMSFRAGEDRQMRDARIASTNPMGRVATLDEISSAVLWLCSDESSYLVGHDLVVDGGASI